MLVSDIMTLDPCCCTADETARAAAGQMRQLCLGVLPVVENMENRRIVGMVTDRDLCLGVVAAGRVPAHVTVGECMTREVVCCRAGESVERALQSLRDHHVHRLPVVDSAGQLLGIISLSDIVRYGGVPEPEIMAVLTHICEPLGPLGKTAHPGREAAAH